MILQTHLKYGYGRKIFWIKTLLFPLCASSKYNIANEFENSTLSVCILLLMIWKTWCLCMNCIYFFGLQTEIRNCTLTILTNENNSCRNTNLWAYLIYEIVGRKRYLTSIHFMNYPFSLCACLFVCDSFQNKDLCVSLYKLYSRPVNPYQLFDLSAF